MKLFALLILLSLLILPMVDGHKPDDFSLSISLTRGERSRDSNSQTTAINIKGRTLLYEKSYRGYRASKREAVKKSFQIKEADVLRLKSLIRDKGLLVSDSLAVAEEESGVRRYFAITLNINQDGKKSIITISGPSEAAAIKEKKIYQSADALLEAVYEIINEQDAGIGYENRYLINSASR